MHIYTDHFSGERPRSGSAHAFGVENLICACILLFQG